ncbi:MAG: hypothetical protein KDD70_18020, partial [Bdellovibrionales bacterium]|nr:hypothetical protein [Bdellovibrionales bacterium]
EAREVLVARTLSEGGSWIVPTRNGVIASKPPLHHWISASISLLVGVPVNCWIHRAISSLFALGSLILVVTTLIQLGARQQAKIALFVLALTPDFLRLASDARVDMVFAFFVFAATLSLILAISEAESIRDLHRRSFLWPAFAMAFAALTKGPLGIVLPLFMACAALLYRFRLLPSLGFLLRPRFAWIPILLIGPGWYVLGAISAGGPFIERHLFENVARITGGSVIVEQPIWYYLATWLKGAFPWSLVFIFFVLSRRVLSGKRTGPFCLEHRRVYELEKLLFLALAAGTFLLSLSSGKRSAYLLPLYPLFAMYLSIRLVDLYQLSSKRWWMVAEQAWSVVHIMTAVLAVLLLLIVVASNLLWLNNERMSMELMQYFTVNRWLLLPGTLLLVLLFLFSFFNRSLISFAVVAIVVFMFGIGEGVKAQFKGYRSFAEAVHNITGDAASVAVAKDWNDERFDAILFYLNRPVSILPPGSSELEKFDYQISIGGTAPILAYETFSSERKGSREIFTLLQGRKTSEPG